MRRTSLALVLFAAAAAVASPSRYARHSKRSGITTDASELAGQTFDYVIVGGGTAGLVLAGRLSANQSVSVAVIEAGLDGSAVQDDIDMPAQAYFDGIASLQSDYDWHYQTSAQANLGGREIFWPRGKVVGGSSAVNGLYMIRASEIEHDSWATLVNDSATWGWDAIYPYMLKSENYTAPLAANQELAGVIVEESYHGQEGPIHFSYPGFFYEQTGEWIETLANLGVESRDPGDGKSYGAFIATSAIDPSTWKRSYSKSGYLDPVTSRPNLFVLTGHQATRIVLDGTTATGVEFAATAAGQTYTVSASKEVILSAGVIGSPQLLQLSGIGDSALLGSLGIPVVKDLPGVGMHLTDHLSGQISFSVPNVTFSGDMVTTNETFAAEQMALFEAVDPSSLYNSPNHAVAYVNLTTLLGDAQAATFIEQLNANQTAIVEAYSTNAAVQRGYAATYAAEVRDIMPSAVGQAELLLSNTGTYGAYGEDVKTMSIQAAIQHPLSRGSVQINSTSAFDPPVVDAGYLTHPADIQILVAAFKYARTISQTQPLASLIGEELAPGSAVQTDAEWETFVRGQVSTEYHPAGTCSMLQEVNGGVVDNALRVYGISGLRVVDSSIVPIGMSAHMTAPLYGVAERAYDLIISTPVAVGGSVSEASTRPSSSSSAAGSSSTRSPAGSSTSPSGASQSGAPSQNDVSGASAFSLSFAGLVAAVVVAVLAQ